jgi:hypothetical protein
LKKTLAQVGRGDQVICTYDDFSFGPITADDPRARARWCEEHLFSDGLVETFAMSEAVLAELRAASRAPIIWVGRRSAQSMAGFLWCLWHIGPAPCEVIETDWLSSLDCERMAELLDTEAPLMATTRARHRVRWEHLRRDNAPFRVVERGVLVSARIDHFDGALLSVATGQWRKMAWTVGMTLRKFRDEGADQASELVLWARLVHLAEAGKLEWRGNLDHLHEAELRLPES